MLPFLVTALEKDDFKNEQRIMIGHNLWFTGCSSMCTMIVECMRRLLWRSGRAALNCSQCDNTSRIHPATGVCSKQRLKRYEADIRCIARPRTISRYWSAELLTRAKQIVMMTNERQIPKCSSVNLLRIDFDLFLMNGSSSTGRYIESYRNLTMGL